MCVLQTTESMGPRNRIQADRATRTHVHVRYMLSPDSLSVVCLSVTFVRRTQAVQIFGNISTALGTLAIRGHPLKILRRSSRGNPSAGELNRYRSILLPLLCLTPPTEGFPWEDLRKIFCGCQRMAKVPYAVEILPKI